MINSILESEHALTQSLMAFVRSKIKERPVEYETDETIHSN